MNTLQQITTSRKKIVTEDSSASFFFCLTGAVFILGSIFFWISDQAEDAITIVNMFEPFKNYALVINGLLTFIGLFLIGTSGYITIFAKRVVLDYSRIIEILNNTPKPFAGFSDQEKKVKTFSLQRIITNCLKISLILIIGMILFSTMRNKKMIANTEVVLFIIIYPSFIFFKNLVKLNSKEDYRTLNPDGNEKYDEVNCENTKVPIRILANQIGYVYQTYTKTYEALILTSRIISNTTCWVYNKSYFRMKEGIMELYPDPVSGINLLKVNIEIEPVFENFPSIIDEKTFHFFQIFLDAKGHKLFLESLVSDDIFRKLNGALHENEGNAIQFIDAYRKNDSDINSALRKMIDRTSVQDISIEIKDQIIQKLNESLGVAKNNAFLCKAVICEKIDRLTESKVLKAKAEQDKVHERNDGIEIMKTKKDIYINHLTAGVLIPENLNIVVEDRTYLNDQRKPLLSVDRPTAEQTTRINRYATQFVTAYEYLLEHGSDSEESNLKYLSSLSLFQEYPAIKPADIFSELKAANRDRREEKMREVIYNLIKSQ
jgi:hypothetical protein